MKHTPIWTLAAALALGGTVVSAEDAPPSPTLEQTPTTVAWLPPTEESKRPTTDGWKHAKPLKLPRAHAHCTAMTLREWVKISCKPHKHAAYFGVRVIGGPHDDVRINDRERDEHAAGTSGVGTEVVFPMRRGDRRLIELGRIKHSDCFKCYTIEETTEAVISAVWLNNAAAPTIVVI